jgi:tRNA-dihydrouridine synthase
MMDWTDRHCRATSTACWRRDARLRTEMVTSGAVLHEAI